MSHTFVTSFIDLNILETRSEEKSSNTYKNLGHSLLNLPFNFIVFMDSETRKSFPPDSDRVKFIIQELKDFPVYNEIDKSTVSLPPDSDRVKFIIQELKDFPVYNEIDKSTVSLPSKTTPTKDSYNYMVLMLSKTYMVKCAILSGLFKTDRYSWIDFGILHIINQDEGDIFYKSMVKINEYTSSTKKIRIPGCYCDRIVGYRIITDVPDWTFCGGFFSGEVAELLEFSKKVEDSIKILKELKIICWEVNLWAYLYRLDSTIFEWYLADHKISMLSNF